MRELFVSFTIVFHNGNKTEGDAVCSMFRGESLNDALIRVKCDVKEQIPEVSTVIATSVYITPLM